MRHIWKQSNLIFSLSFRRRNFKKAERGMTYINENKNMRSLCRIIRKYVECVMSKKSGTIPNGQSASQQRNMCASRHIALCVLCVEHLCLSSSSSSSARWRERSVSVDLMLCAPTYRLIDFNRASIEIYTHMSKSTWYMNMFEQFLYTPSPSIWKYEFTACTNGECDVQSLCWNIFIYSHCWRVTVDVYIFIENNNKRSMRSGRVTLTAHTHTHTRVGNTMSDASS